MLRLVPRTRSSSRSRIGTGCANGQREGAVVEIGGERAIVELGQRQRRQRRRARMRLLQRPSRARGRSDTESTPHNFGSTHATTLFGCAGACSCAQRLESAAAGGTSMTPGGVSFLKIMAPSTPPIVEKMAPITSQNIRPTTRRADHQADAERHVVARIALDHVAHFGRHRAGHLEHALHHRALHRRHDQADRNRDDELRRTRRRGRRAARPARRRPA